MQGKGHWPKSRGAPYSLSREADRAVEASALPVRVSAAARRGPRGALPSGGQLESERSPPPGLRLRQAKLSRKSNQVARGRIRRFESYMPSQPVHLQRVTYGSRSESINLQMRCHELNIDETVPSGAISSQIPISSFGRSAGCRSAAPRTARGSSGFPGLCRTPHCGALYSVTHSRRSKSDSNVATCVVLPADHGRVGFNQGSDLQAYSSA